MEFVIDYFSLRNIVFNALTISTAYDLILKVPEEPDKLQKLWDNEKTDTGEM